MLRTALACALLTSASPAQQLSWRGRVLEKAALEPVPDALVQVQGSALSARTGADGRFEIKGEASAVNLGCARPETSASLVGGELRLFVPEGARRVDVEAFRTTGETFFSLAWHPPSAGWNHLPLGGANTPAFARARVDGGAPVALAKAAATGIDVSHAGLAAKSVAASGNDQDFGDIVLEYPPRKLDVGAAPPYGAAHLFDGSKGKAAAEAEMKQKWQDWLPNVAPAEKAKYTAATNTFKIAKDPQYPSDTARVALQSCCNPLWGYDDLQARAVHGDAQIHVEFTCMGEYDATENANENDPYAEVPKGKGYCNSGVYIQSRYEAQIYSVTLDPAAKPNDDHNWMAALVGEHIPTKNVNRKNGAWQAYDITFRSARYGAAPAKARVSIWWNGTLVHDNVELAGISSGTANHSGEEINATLYGLKLQSEGRDVRYRNIWLKPLDIKAAQTTFGF